MAEVIKKIKVGDDINPVEQAFYLSTSTGASDGTGLSTVAGNGSSGSYKSVRWYIKDVAGINAPYDGMRIAVKVPLNGVSTAGIILSINGDTDADYHPVAYNVNTVLTSHFPQNTIKVFTYDASQTMTCYKASNTAVTVTGVWKADANYDSNTTVTYGTLEYYFRPYAGTQALYRYKFCMLDKDNRVVPLTITNVANGTAVTNQTPTNVAFRPDKIWWYCTTTTISAGALLGGQTLWRSGYNANNATNGGMAICNFNSTIGTYKLIYLCGTYDKTTGLFSLRGGGTASSTQYYTQVPTNTANITLSSYFTSGYDYILLGGTYSSNNYIQLFDNNPMFHFDGTNLVPYDTWNTAQASSNQKVQGNGTGFGADATVNIVGGGNVTVAGDATNNKITVSYTTPASLPANGGNAASLGGSAPAYYLSYGNFTNTPASLKNPNALHVYGETTKVLDYDGSATKSLYIKSSTTNGAFTVSDGTTSKLIQLAGSFTDTTYGAQSGITLANSKYGHANTAITAGTTQSVYSIKYDSYGHITAATAVTIPSTADDVGAQPADYFLDDVVDGLSAAYDAGTAGFLYYDSNFTGATSVLTSSIDYVTVGAASAGHTHTLSLATSTGTAAVNLAFGTSYKLSAGGNNLIFKMPAAPTATGYAGYLSLSANSYTNGTQWLSFLYADGIYAGDDHLDIGAPVVSISGAKVDIFALSGTSLNLAAISVNQSGILIPYGSINIGGSFYGAGASLLPSASDTVVTGENVYVGTGARYLFANSSSIGMRTGGASIVLSGKSMYLYASSAYTAGEVGTLSIYGNQIRISGSTISISANPTLYLSASSYVNISAGDNTYLSLQSGAVSLYGKDGLDLKTGGGPMYIWAGSTVATAANIYMSGSTVYISATNGRVYMSGAAGIDLTCTSGNNSYVTIHRINLSSAPVVAAVEHNIKFFCSGKWNVRFTVLDRRSYAAVRTATGSVGASTTTGANALVSLASLLYYNLFSSEYGALPVCAGVTTAGLAANGIPIAIYASGPYSTSMYFVFANNTNSASIALISFATTGNSSYFNLYDNRQIKQGN